MKVFGLNFFLIVFLQFLFSLSAQSRTENDTLYSITFVRSISQVEDFGKSESVLQNIWDFVVGSSNSRLLKPVDVITNGKKILVLDQGNKGIVSIDTVDFEFELIENESRFESTPSTVSICNFNNNDFLFTDSYLNKIFLFDSDDEKIKLLNDELELNQPTGILFNQAQNEIWVVETKNHLIKVLDSKGNYLRSIGKRGTGNLEFNFPTFIHYDTGKIYIVDAMNFRIQILDSKGDFINSFGKAGDASGYFASIKGISVDNSGKIYIVDGLFNAVQIFDSNGNFLSYFGSKGSEPGKFLLPVGIYIDAEDNIYVADSYNSRIQIFKKNNNG